MGGAGYCQSLMWMMLYENGSQLSLVPTTFLAQILPAFVDCPDTLSRLPETQIPLSRPQLFRAGGLSAKDVVVVTLDLSKRVMAVTANAYLVVAAASSRLALAYLPALSWKLDRLQQPVLAGAVLLQTLVLQWP